MDVKLPPKGGARRSFHVALAEFDTLFESLLEACAAAGSTAVLPRRSDVDTVEDLVALRGELVGDLRPARRALASWLTAQPDLRE